MNTVLARESRFIERLIYLQALVMSTTSDKDCLFSIFRTVVSGIEVEAKNVQHHCKDVKWEDQTKDHWKRYQLQSHILKRGKSRSWVIKKYKSRL